MRLTLSLIVLLLVAGTVSAQKYPERGLVRKGNRQFGKEKYERAVDSYTRALEKAPGNFEAMYDLSSALFRSERYERAEQTLSKICTDSTRTDLERSEAVYNLGNTQFVQQKLKEALASYRMAMRLNPDDQEAKYNYAYTKKLLQDQQNQQNQQDQQNQNQDQNQDKDQNKDQNQNGDQDQNSDKQDDQSGQDQPQQSGMDRQTEAMLDAIQAQEDKTQDKLKEKAGVVIRSKKNW